MAVDAPLDEALVEQIARELCVFRNEDPDGIIHRCHRNGHYEQISMLAQAITETRFVLIAQTMFGSATLQERITKGLAAADAYRDEWRVAAESAVDPENRKLFLRLADIVSNTKHLISRCL